MTNYNKCLDSFITQLKNKRMYSSEEDQVLNEIAEIEMERNTN